MDLAADGRAPGRGSQREARRRGHYRHDAPDAGLRRRRPSQGDGDDCGSDVPREGGGPRTRRPGGGAAAGRLVRGGRSEEHTSELQSLMRISYAVFCLKKKKTKKLGKTK